MDIFIYMSSGIQYPINIDPFGGAFDEAPLLMLEYTSKDAKSQGGTFHAENTRIYILLFL